jgi:electron transfer flavoprotein beta subunit
MASTDGTMGVVPAMLAERLGLPQVTYASELTVDGGKVTIRRDGDAASRRSRPASPRWSR